jgi:hypothetical protein
MSTSSIPTVLDELRTKLMAVTALAGVTVSTAPLGTEDPPEAIVFSDVSLSEELLAMGTTRRETYTIDGMVYIQKPGAGEMAIKAARDRAFAILAEVETYLTDNPTINSKCLDSDLKSVKLTQAVAPNIRIAFIEFGIKVDAIKTP